MCFGAAGSATSNDLQHARHAPARAVPFMYATPVAQSHWNLCVSRLPRSDFGRDETPVSAIVVTNFGGAGR